MKLFVWDFHGVLEKDNDLAVLDISNQVLAQAGYDERFSDKDNKEYYGLKWYEYFERLLPNLTKAEHMALQTACFSFEENHLDVLARHIKPNDNAIDVLEIIQNAGHDQIILSNTRPSDLLWFVGAVRIKRYFPHEKIIGVNAHEKHGNKTEALKDYLHEKNFDAIVHIGDSESDMKLKDVAGGTTYFYNHPYLENMAKVAADYVIDDLRRVLREV
jgi:phosphoglycolate phosphatase-like HAD superfamily hydrolase